MRCVQVCFEQVTVAGVQTAVVLRLFEYFPGSALRTLGLALKGTSSKHESTLIERKAPAHGLAGPKGCHDALAFT